MAAANPLRSPELLITYTLFRTTTADSPIERADVPWSELAQRIKGAPTYADKAHCPLISLSEYGSKPSAKGSLRHAPNVLRVSGAEVDYDGKKVSPAEAAALLQAANIEAVIYTTPSHTADAPRWRVLLPFSEPALPDKRAEYLGRANRILGGIAARESFDLSRSYYVGRVRGVPYDVIETHGRPVDMAAEIEPQYPSSAGNGAAEWVYDTTTDEEWRATFAKGSGRYTAMVKLSSRWGARGMALDDIKAALRDLFAQHPNIDPRNSDGIDLRMKIPEVAESAVRKFGESRAKSRQGDGQATAQPTPLVKPVAPARPYPLDALGPILGPAATAVMRYVQVPDALAAHSVLACAALAVQPHANVQTLGGPRPISLFMLTVAESGERKTAADALARTVVDEHRKRLQVQYNNALREHDAAHEGHKMRIKRAKEGAADPDALAAVIREIQEEPPPRKPCFIASDPSAEGLFISLRDGQYSQALATDEAGQFLGGYAMSEESELRTITLLSRLWDGTPIDRVRATEKEHTTLFGRRLAVHLMAQPEVANRLLGKSLYRSQGLLSRFLICQPASTIGTRLHDGTTADPTTDPRLLRYRHAVRQLLELPTKEDPEAGGLNPRCLALAPEARVALVHSYDKIETAMRDDGELATVREFASKAAEHACRLAAVLTLIAKPDAVCVSVETMGSALQLAQAYILEHVRLAGAAAISEEVDNAVKLMKWIERKELRQITPRQVMQFGPYAIREAPAAKAALRMLVEYGWLLEDGKRFVVAPGASAAG